MRNRLRPYLQPVVVAIIALLNPITSAHAVSHHHKKYGAENIPIHDSTSNVETVSLNDLKVSAKARNYVRTGLELTYVKAIDQFDASELPFAIGDL